MSKAKKGGAKLTRTETVTVRLDPKLRYLAELASRKQRRTLSSYIEWAIEHSLKNDLIHDDYNNNETFLDAANRLWDVSEVDRFIQLAQSFPNLLTHDEQVLWKLLYTVSAYNLACNEIVRFYSSEDKKLHMDLIRICWKELKGVVDGSISEETLKEIMINNWPF